MNLVDLLILVIIAYFAFQGFNQGIISIAIELAGYILSYIVALRYGSLGTSLVGKYLPQGLPASYEATIGIALIWTLSMFVYYLLAPFIIQFIPPFITHSTVNRVGGVLGSMLKGLIFISIVLFVMALLPLPAQIRTPISQSVIASRIIDETNAFEQKFGGNVTAYISDTIKQITLIPSNLSSQPAEKLIELGYTVSNTSVDTSDEMTMFNYVNTQREAHHLKPLKLNQTLTTVAQNYGKYMFANGFFGHITPSGQSPYDRITKTGINFTYVGENIAKAPDVASADTGFINSPEHKANILDVNYTQIGVGVIDGGEYGKMFVQDFTG